MSQRTEQVEESSDTVDEVLDLLEEWYHVPALAVMLGFMLWIRLRSYDNFTRGGEVFFTGNDAWYHLRQVTYTVQNWPATMPFDPWTYYPFGTSAGQFGTLYDQLIATAALVVGLGDPSHNTVALTLLVAPAVFGTLVAVPTYLIGKRLGGRFGGLFGVLILALLPGQFLQRGLVGFADHNVAEPFFQAFAVLAMMVALSVAEAEKPVYELVADRDIEGLRRPLAWSVLAGIATALYLWTWPPGVLLLGIFGAFYTLALTGDYLRGASPDHVAFVGATSMTVTGLLALVPLGTISGFSPTNYSLLQPLVAFAVAGGSVFMAWLAREWDARDASPSLYPVAIFGLIAVGALVVSVALPDLFNMIRSNLVRFIGFNAGAAQRTIAEAKPFLQGGGLVDAVVPVYGFTFFTAIAGALVMLWRAFAGDDHRTEHLLVLVWTVFITSAAFTQVRFNYYLVVPVAVLNAYLIGQVIGLVGLAGRPREAFDDVEGYQVMVVLFVVMLVLPALVFPIQVGGQRTPTAMDYSESAFPDAVNWDGTLDWLRTETPAEGNYGGVGNNMSYYGTYDQTDGDFDYPNGSYGVMSWWDYGHWITVEGERIPNANPFQQGATTAAKYLLAPSEQRANEIIRTLGDDEEDTRYVTVDWKMVNTRGRSGNVKFFAPTVFHPNRSSGEYIDTVLRRQGGGFYLHSQSYYESMMVRLYKFHGSAAEPSSQVVVDYDERTFRTENGQVTQKLFPQDPNASVVRQFDTMEAAREFVREDGSARIGGIGPYPSERIPALEHYRLVKRSEASSLQSRMHQRVLLQRANLIPGAGFQSMFETNPAWVKMFERVPGATVEGTGPANTTITASAQLSPQGTNSTFTYTQQAETGQDGAFTMTLPYATTGYDDWGPEEGYTNTTVRATGPYEFRTPQSAGENGFVFRNATAQVTEGQVIGEDDGPVTVSVDNRQTIEVGGANNSTGNGTTDNGTDGSGANASALAGPDAVLDDGGDGTADSSRSTQSQGSRRAPTSARAGLVGVYAAGLLLARRD